MPNPPASGLPNPARYDTREPSIVIDEVTGLAWQREVDVEARALDFTRAERHCAALRLGSYDDWRLPSRVELVSLVDFTRAVPALDVAAFPGTQGNFWTASPAARVETPRRAWQVSFAIGASSIASGTASSSARCVRTARATAELGQNRHVVSGQSPNGTLKDLGTGLVWQRTLSAASYTFEQARAYCADLELDGRGYRVPSMKELQTLVDEAKPEGPAVDEQAFPGMPGGRALFWSSSQSAREPTSGWFVNFATGESAEVTTALGEMKNLKNRVRCVR
jgi:hypothetical protein